MELSSKSKLLSFKSKKNLEKNPSSWFCENSANGDTDVVDLFEPVKENSKTPVTTLTSLAADGCNRSPISCSSSPQFRVGWNETLGTQEKSCGMSSPVSALPNRRKIRRCPENLLSKISTPRNESEKKEEEGDILQCISWAKNLLESTSFQDQEEGQHGENVTKISEPVKDMSIDILDDSSNELMILCSQAIEEKAVKEETNIIKRPEKHLITPDHDRFVSKRTKKEESSSSVSTKYHGKSIRKSAGLRSHDEDFSKKFNLKHSFVKNDIFKRPELTVRSISPLSHQKRSPKKFNLNHSYVKCDLQKNSCESNIKNLSNNNNNNNNDNDISCNVLTATGKIDFSSNVRVSNDDIKSHLDDEDDLFCSLDFDHLDWSQKKNNIQKPVILPKPVGQPKEQQLNTKSQVTKYTKEEIEKRRIEAKKRLFLKKKQKSK